MSIETTLERYIGDTLLLGKRTSIGPDESLIGSGILDSLTLLELIAFVEKTFELEISEAEMTPENFQSISRIKEFVEGKQAGGTVQGRS